MLRLTFFTFLAMMMWQVSALDNITVAENVKAKQINPNEIFSAIDGEYNHLEDDHLGSLSSEESVALMNEVLSGIDGEYDHSFLKKSGSNSDDSSYDTALMKHILFGIDGEHE